MLDVVVQIARTNSAFTNYTVMVTISSSDYLAQGLTRTPGVYGEYLAQSTKA
jgi:hypothetical protein